VGQDREDDRRSQNDVDEEAANNRINEENGDENRIVYGEELIKAWPVEDDPSEPSAASGFPG